jgi:transcription elongation factor SPT6
MPKIRERRSSRMYVLHLVIVTSSLLTPSIPLQIFEPSEIQSRMLTAEDDRIRTLDIPERMQLSSVGLAAPITSSDDIDNPTAPFIPEDEITDAANWMASQISTTATEHFALQDAQGNLPELHEQFLKAVADVIRFINVQFLEVPFIWAHRGDFLVHRAAAESGQQDTAFLDQDDCWRIAHLSIKYRALAQRKAELRKTFNTLEADDEYFEDVFDRVKSVEDVADLSEWVGMKYSRKLAEIKEEKMREEEALAEEGEQPKRKKRATRESAYENAKRNVVSKLAEVSARFRCAPFASR